MEKSQFSGQTLQTGSYNTGGGGGGGGLHVRVTFIHLLKTIMYK